MTRPINIRPVRGDETNLLREFSIATFIDTYARHNTPENINSYIENAFDADRLQQELKSDHIRFFFAEHDEDILGYLRLNFGAAQTNQSLKNACEIERIYVGADYQGMKIGKSLFQHSVQVGQAAGLSWIWLGVWDQNEKAIGFYEKVGFETFGTHDFKLGTEQQTDLLLRFSLAPR